MASRDLYEILGVDRRASQEEIKQAYRRLAREMHPDVRRDDPHATDRFKEVNEAYAVLSDPAKRSQYDRFGRVDLDTGRFDPGASPLDDLFEMFFGARPAARTGPQGPERGADLRYDLEVTLEEVAAGSERRIEVSRLETCPACFGTGAERGSSPQPCPACRGTGEARVTRRTMFGVMTQIGPCAQCEGTGTYISDPCRSCRGAGQAMARREITVTVPAGVEDGTRLRLAGEGEAGVRGGPRGDLYVVVRLVPHPVFNRRGRDLHAEAEITMTQAALGGQMRFPGLGREEAVAIPAGAQPGDTITLRGRGLPDLRGNRGDLHVHLRVTIPRRLSSEQRTLLEVFARSLGEAPRGRGERQPGRRRQIINKVKDLLQ
jgi:molecular chaperone DnaJ